jgi:hypothetical protein
VFTSDAVNPAQRLRTAHLHGMRQIDAARIPLYGLPPNWPGDRFTGDTEFSTGVTRDLDGVRPETHETVDLMHEDGVGRLTAQSSDRALSIDDETLLALVPGAVIGALLTLRLDGHAIAFATARTDEVVVARWAGYEATVTVTAVRWPMESGLELVRITDLAPYHAGRLRQLEERSGLDLHE